MTRPSYRLAFGQRNGRGRNILSSAFRPPAKDRSAPPTYPRVGGARADAAYATGPKTAGLHPPHNSSLSGSTRR